MVAASLFTVLPARVAMLTVFLGGWILLPVGVYPPARPETLAWWVTGLALPGDHLVSKAWVAPAVALTGGVLCDWKRVAAFRPALIDLPMIAWCLWPLVAAMIVGIANPGPLAAAAYLTASWGAAWAIGRIWFSDPDGQHILLRSLALAGLACLPIALLEGWQLPFLHDIIYGPHPFRFDGADRYIGYRPLGFFENGNQYGIWISLCAVAAVWWAMTEKGRVLPRWIAALTIGLALASQSVGAILLGTGAILTMAYWSKRIVRRGLTIFAALAVIGGAVQFSGTVPVRQLVEQTNTGQAALALIRGMGRGSFAWRVSQDLKTLDGVRAAPVAGSGQWNWWQRFGTRPWGLLLLIAGQYGFVGLALALSSLVIACVVMLARQSSVTMSAPLALAAIALAAIGDATMNAFLFFPAILAAGAIATAFRQDCTKDESRAALAWGEPS